MVVQGQFECEDTIPAAQIDRIGDKTPDRRPSARIRAGLC